MRRLNTSPFEGIQRRHSSELRASMASHVNLGNVMRILRIHFRILAKQLSGAEAVRKSPQQSSKLNAPSHLKLSRANCAITAFGISATSEYYRMAKHLHWPIRSIPIPSARVQAPHGTMCIETGSAKVGITPLRCRIDPKIRTISLPSYQHLPASYQEPRLLLSLQRLGV